MTEKIAPRMTPSPVPYERAEIAHHSAEALSEDASECNRLQGQFSSIALELAAMMLHLTGKTKALERSLQHADQRAEDALRAGELREMRTEANAARVSGFVSGFAGVASSSFNFASIAKLDKGAETAASRLWENIGKTAEASGALATVPFQGIAKDAQVAAKDLADHARRASDRAAETRSTLSDAASFETRLLERTSQLSEAEAQCRAAAVLRA